MASARVVDVADLPILIEADSPDRWAIVEESLGAVSSSTAEPRATISYTAKGSAPPGRPPEEVRDTLALWRHGTTLVARHPLGPVATVNPGSARIGGEVEPSPLGFRHLLQVSMTHLLAHHDRFLLHGGGIVGRQGGFVVLGGSGFGKSTLTVAAFRAGWSVMCDDLVVARGLSDGAAVTGIPRPWVVPADIAEQAGLSGQQLAVADSRDRRRLDGVAFTGGWFRAAGTILVAHGQGAPEPEPLPANQALRMILGSFFCAGDPALTGAFLPVAASLARLPAWRFCHASDADLRLAAAVNNLATIGEPPGDA